MYILFICQEIQHKVNLIYHSENLPERSRHNLSTDGAIIYIKRDVSSFTFKVNLRIVQKREKI